VVALPAAEGKVGHDLGHMELADQGSVGVQAVQAVVRGAPQPPKVVEPDAVVALVVGGEHLAAGKSLPVDDVEDADVAPLAVHHEQALLVRGEGQPVRLGEVGGDRLEVA
jgi:hypothetical protein